MGLGFTGFWGACGFAGGGGETPPPRYATGSAGGRMCSILDAFHLLDHKIAFR